MSRRILFSVFAGLLLHQSYASTCDPNLEFINSVDENDSEMPKGYCISSDNPDSYVVWSGLAFDAPEYKLFVREDGSVVVTRYSAFVVSETPPEPVVTHIISSTSNYGEGPYYLCLDSETGFLEVRSGDCSVELTLYDKGRGYRELVVTEEGRVILVNAGGKELYSFDKY